MSFRFRIVKVWHFEKVPNSHVVGLLEEGKIIPPVIAHILEQSGHTAEIESVALGRGKPFTGDPNEMTLVVGKTTVPLQSLEGCYLVDDD
jgi:hypothetical protein